jgi:serine/threonine protein kinase/WD40 repeat protein
MRLEESFDEESIFDEALSLPAGPERDSLIDRRCGPNNTLRTRVLALLAAYETSDDLETPIYDAFTAASRPATLVGQRVGRFDILEQLGEGGMGEVYLARDSQDPRTLVAVKVIKPGMDSRQVLARFELECKALRDLDHPHIAKWIDAGVTPDNRPFIVMELVRGLSIIEYCDRETLTIEGRIRLMIDVCAAVQHAHGHGIVHRDLKPSNVLVTLHMDEPIVKVIDFGVAKALDTERPVDTRCTLATHWIGTPCYMSPEQARWSSAVDARTDVYSLGAILYELLTGSTPLEPNRASQMDLDELRAVIRDEEPSRPSLRIAKRPSTEADVVGRSRRLEPSRLARQIRGDLDWITLKSLEKDRDRRYASAGELGSDLLAVLEHRRPSVGRPSVASQLVRWTKRNRRGLQAAATVCLLAFVLFGLITVHRIRKVAQSHEQASAESQQRAEHELASVEFAQDIRTAAALIENRDYRSARPLLETWRREGSPFRDRFVLNYLRWIIPDPICELHGHQHELLDMDVSPDQKWMASSDRGGDIIIWDINQAREVRRLHPTDFEVMRVRFSPDGKYLATSGWTETGLGRRVTIWNVADWSRLGEFDQHERTIYALGWSPDGKLLASGDRDGVVHIWEVASKALQHTLGRHAKPVLCLAWSPDGKMLATATSANDMVDEHTIEEGVHVWDTKTWKRKQYISHNGKGTLAIAFSDDSCYMAFGGYGGELVIADLRSPGNLLRMTTHSQIGSLVFGHWYELVVGGFDGSIEVLQYCRTKNQWVSVRTVQVSDSMATVRAIVSVGGDRICVASQQDRAIRIYAKASVTGYQAGSPIPMPVGSVESSNLVLVPDESGVTEVKRSDNGQTVFRIPDRVRRSCRAAYCARNDRVALISDTASPGTVFLYRRTDWKLETRFELPGEAFTLSFSRDGRYLAASGYGALDNSCGLIRVWDLETRSALDLEQGRGSHWSRAVFSPHRDLLILGNVHSRKLTCLRAGTFDVIREVEVTPWKSLMFFHEQDALVVGEENRLSVWTGDLSRKRWSSIASTSEHGVFNELAITLDETMIAAVHGNWRVEFIDCRSRTELFSRSIPWGGNNWLAFMDPSTLVIDSTDGSSAFEAANVAGSQKGAATRGNSLIARDYSWVPPVVTGTSPAISAGSLPRGTESLEVHFSKPVLTAGNLVGWWTGNNVTTDSANGNHGSLANGASYGAGQVGESFSFDGVDDFVQVGAPASLRLTKQLTIEAWINASIPASGSIQIIANKEGEYELGISKSGSLWYTFANTSCAWCQVNTGYVLKPNMWYHLALTCNVNSIKLFVNGAVVHAVDATGPIGDYSPDANDFRIGGRQLFDEYFAGRIDELGVFNRALSDAEIQAIYRAGLAGNPRNVPPLFEMRRAGGDGVLGTADDVGVPLKISNSGATSTIKFAPLKGGSYRLTAADGITDLAGNRLDGDFDGTSGGDYVRDFDVRRK